MFYGAIIKNIESTGYEDRLRKGSLDFSLTDERTNAGSMGIALLRIE